ncbi:hypothetical protein HDU79_011419 [Rhizoclosmatium sp. JEL0117]|nr:hypothetical protein HDU79_011419 [Rhizoclosmatium sp. JEL0117]
MSQRPPPPSRNANANDHYHIRRLAALSPKKQQRPKGHAILIGQFSIAANALVFSDSSPLQLIANLLPNARISFLKHASASAFVLIKWTKVADTLLVESLLPLNPQSAANLEMNLVEFNGESFEKDFDFDATVRFNDPIKQKWQGLNISDLLLLDDIYSTLLSYDPSTSHDFASSCFQLSKKILQRSKGFMDWPVGAGDPRLSAVLAHDTECTVAELRYLQPFLVSLDMILGKEDNNDSEPGIVQEYIINLSNEDVSEKPGGREYAFRVFSQEELGMDGCFLMGKIEWEDGGLKFTDSSGSSPVLIVLLDSPNETEWKLSPEILGTCVIILDFEVIVEVLGVCYTGEQGSAQPLLKVYIRCFKKDLLFRQWFLESMDVNCGEAVTQIAGGRNERDSLDTILLRVEEKSMPTLDIGMDGVVGVKARVFGIVGRVIAQDGSVQINETFENCVCELFQEVMPYWPVLQRGECYLITGVKFIFFEDQDGGRNASLYCQLTSESEITTVNIQSAPTVEQNGTFDFGHQNPILYLDFSPLPDPQTVQSLLSSLVSAPIPPKSFHTTLVTVQGTIISKSFTAKATWDMHERLPAHTLFQDHNIGLGRYDRVLVLKLTDPRHASGFHNPADSTLQIYLDVRNSVFQPGLLPGTTIRIHKLGIKRAASSRTLYGESVCDTWIEILAPSGPQNTVDSTAKMSIAQHFADTMHTLPRIHLLNVYSIPPTLKTSPFTILFTINHIEQVLLWCECSGCGVKLTSSEIKCTCRRSDSPSLKVQASAKLFIDDGSCEAMLLLESFESVVGLFPATQRKLEDAVLGCRVLREVEYFRNPPWVGEESWVKADTVVESYDNDDVGGIETAKRILYDAIASVSLATDYIACCRQVSSAWFHGNDNEEDLDDDEEYDLENINLKDLYSRIGMKDLTRRQLKVAEGAMITVWSPPRIVLHGYYVEKANPLVEGMRI